MKIIWEKFIKLRNNNSVNTMKPYHFLIFLILLLMLTPFVSGEQQTLGTFQRDNCIDLVQTCGNCTFVNFTAIYFPNGTLAEANLTTIKVGTLFTKQFCNTTVLGTYVVNGFGDADGDVVFAYDFDITSTGIKESNSPLSIAITIFFITLNIGLFMLYFMKQSFHDNKYTNFIIKRALLVISIFFTIFTLSIIGSLAAASNYDLMHQIYGLMEIVGWIGYVSIVILIIATLFQWLGELKNDKKEKRTGGDYD